jgi:N-carbamoylputrescine amidase
VAKSKNKDQVRLGLVQMSAGDDPEANLAKALSHIRRAAEQGAQIVCLQELFRSKYFCQTEDTRHFRLAEAIPGSSTEALGAVAKDKQIVIVASLFERRSAGIYHNTAVVIDADGAIAGKYRKMHIPDDPGFHEKYYFTHIIFLRFIRANWCVWKWHHRRASPAKHYCHYG